MNFNGGFGYIGTGPIVGPITIDGDLTVVGDIVAIGDVKSATAHTVDLTAVDTQTTDLTVTGSTSVQDLEGKTVSLTDMPVVVTAVAIQTIPTGGASLDVQWSLYDNTQSNPSPPTALVPVVINTEQEIQETGNWTLEFSVSIITDGGYTGTIQINTLKQNGGPILISGPQNIPVFANGVYTATWSTTRYFTALDRFKVVVSTGVVPADFSVSSYLTATRVS